MAAFGFVRLQGFTKCMLAQAECQCLLVQVSMLVRSGLVVLSLACAGIDSISAPLLSPAGGFAHAGMVHCRRLACVGKIGL